MAARSLAYPPIGFGMSPGGRIVADTDGGPGVALDRSRRTVMSRDDEPFDGPAGSLDATLEGASRAGHLTGSGPDFLHLRVRKTHFLRLPAFFDA